MTLTRAEFDRIERKLRLESRNAKDRICFFVYGGKRVLFTKRSHARGELPTADMIRQQLKLSDSQFRGLINCPFDYDDYVAHLRSRAII
jgi:hypothetical protein